jgi:hypothetical protein
MGREGFGVKKPWVLGGLGAVGAVSLALGLWMRGPRIPSRPADVPAAAEWAGRGAAGRFFLVEGRQGMIYTIQVFEAGSGARAAGTKWRLVGYARTGLGADEIAGMEGGAILLKDGSRLLPVE